MKPIYSVIRLIALAGICGFVAVTANAQMTVIRAERMLDVRSGKIQRPGIIVVHGDRIASVGDSNVPSDATVFDLGDATLLPGLIDLHIHLMDEPGADWIKERIYETPATWALRGAKNARLALRNGFTTVRDIGSSGFVDVALMHATDDGWIDGPRIFPVGHYITSTGGYCDLTGFAPGVLERGPESGVADGAD